MTQDLYTVYTDAGRVERGLTAEQAVDIYLSNDGRDWEIRPMDGGWRVWDRQRVANKGWAPTTLRSFEIGEADARADIIAQALTLEWYGGVHIMTDADYDAMMVDIAQAD